MSYYVGLDVSVKSVSICVVEADGAVIARGEVPSDPDQIAADLPPGRPSFILRVLGFDSCRFRVWQVRQARRAGIIQTPCVPRLGFCYRARNAA